MIDRDFLNEKIVAYYGKENRISKTKDALSVFNHDLTRIEHNDIKKQELINDIADLVLMVKQIMVIQGLPIVDVSQEMDFKLVIENNRISDYE